MSPVTAKQIQQTVNLASEGISPQNPEDKIVLAVRPGHTFQSMNTTANMALDGSVDIKSTGTSVNFIEMLNQRKNGPQNSQHSVDSIMDLADSGQALPLANVGISVTLELALEGKRYAVVCYRERDDRLMLISGYADSGPFIQSGDDNFVNHLVANAMRETGEEHLAFDPEGSVRRGAVINPGNTGILRELVIKSGSSEGKLQHPFPESGLPASDHDIWTVSESSTPAYLPGVLNKGKVAVEGASFPGAFHFDVPNSSGQLIIPLKLNPGKIEGLSLLHSEDALSDVVNPDTGKKDLLETVLKPRDLVLMELDARGIPTGDTFNLINGKLIRRDVSPEKLTLSEVFAPSTGRAGIINQGNISFNDYKRAVSEA